MRRIVVLITVTLVITAMMAVFSTVAVAEPPGNANACSAAAADPKEFEPNLGLFTSAFIAAQGGQEFSGIIVDLSTGCRQNG
jgi:hypothetical protein